MVNVELQKTDEEKKKKKKTHFVLGFGDGKWEMGDSSTGDFLQILQSLKLKWRKEWDEDKGE